MGFAGRGPGRSRFLFYAPAAGAKKERPTRRPASRQLFEKRAYFAKRRRSSIAMPAAPIMPKVAGSGMTVITPDMA
jgi:hypothetical protein